MWLIQFVYLKHESLMEARSSFTSRVDPGGWEAAGKWTTSCTSSRGRSEFLPKMTWLSREPGGKDTKQSHDTGASSILREEMKMALKIHVESLDCSKIFLYFDTLTLAFK